MPESVTPSSSAMPEAYEQTLAVDEATRGRLLVAVRAVVAVVLVVVLAIAAADHWDRLRSVDDLRLSPAWLAPALPFTLAGGLLLPLAWRHVLWAYGAGVGRRAAVRVWCLSQASRFVPGNVAWV